MRLSAKEVPPGRMEIALSISGQPIERTLVDFRAPLNPQDLRDLAWYLNQYCEQVHSAGKARAKWIAEKLPNWGQLLFDALFGTSAARSIYDRAVKADGIREFWIVSSVPSTLSLPWELLRCSHARSADTSAPGQDLAFAFDLQRAVEAPEDLDEPPRQSHSSLRALIVIARASDSQDVPFRVVARPTVERLRAMGAKVRVLRPPTFEQLQQELKQPWDILHLDLHGSVEKCTVCLHFPDSKVDARKLSELVESNPPHIVVLNACHSATLCDHSARFSGDQGSSELALEASVATALVRARVKAVVAMSHIVQVTAAARFAEAFYTALGSKTNVAAAVRQAREALRADPVRHTAMGDIELVDWCVPVVYAQRSVQFETSPSAARVSEKPAKPIFFGRDTEFLRIEEALREHKVAFLYGLTGVGKSMTAMAFAEWYRSTSGTDSDGDATKILHICDVPLPCSQRELWEVPRSRLASRGMSSDTSTVLVIWDPTQSASGSYLPPAEQLEANALDPCHNRPDQIRIEVLLVANSLDAGAALSLKAESQILIHGLDPNSRAALVEHILRPAGVPSDKQRGAQFDELISHLDGHPQALGAVLPLLRHKEAQDLLAALRVFEDFRSDVWTSLVDGMKSADRLASFSQSKCWLSLCTALLDFAASRDTVERIETLEPSGARSFHSGAAWSTLTRELTGDGFLALTPEDNTPHFHPLFAICCASRLALMRREDLVREARCVRARILTRERAREFPGPLNDKASLQYARLLSRVALDAITLDMEEEAADLGETADNRFTRVGEFSAAERWAEMCIRTIEKRVSRRPQLDTNLGQLWLIARGGEVVRKTVLGEISSARTHLECIGEATQCTVGLTRAVREPDYQHQRGVLERRTGTLMQAKTLFVEALLLRERGMREYPDRASIFLAGKRADLHELGLVASKQGEWKEATQRFEQEEELLKRHFSKDCGALFQCKLELGRAHLVLGNLSETRELASAAVELAEGSFSPNNNEQVLTPLGSGALARALILIARSRIRRAVQGESAASLLNAAEKDYCSALKLANEMGDDSLLVQCEQGMGSIAHVRASIAEAVPRQGTQLEGATNCRHSHLEEAKLWLEQAAERAMKLRLYDEALACYGDLGRVLRSDGKLTDARSTLWNALANLPGELAKLGDVFRITDDLARIEQELSQRDATNQSDSVTA